jgi:signal transduction histidine kinase
VKTRARSEATPLSVLLVEDSPLDAELLGAQLVEAGFEIALTRVETEEEMRAALAAGDPQIILCDYRLPRFSAFEALEVAGEYAAAAPFVILSGTIGEEATVEALKAGARDCVLKSNLGRLGPVVRRELEEAQTRRERQRLEDELRQAQKMEAIGQLAGGFAHDFNNMMTAVVGFSELALARLEQAHPLRRYVEEIRRAGKRASALTSQLLAFSRKQVLQPRVLDLNEVVAEVETLLQRLIGEDVELVSVLDPGLAPIEADPGQLEQVIMNLAINARDAMPTGGKLTIETANASLDADYAASHFDVEPGAYVLLAVSDNGIGMDAETQARIFEPFYTTKEQGKGTGLGLATVFGIIKQSGGDISVYSEPGHGTTIKIYLPRTQARAEPPEPRVARERPPRGSETILLVEDEEIVRSLEREVLEENGYKVLEARSPLHALELAAEHAGAIDLLVTDVVMPELSGRQLAERITTKRPEVKILYTSGYADDAIVRHGVLEPGISLLAKPLTPASLANKVREVLDSPTRQGQPPGD